jgi:hypothetical protein
MYIPLRLSLRIFLGPHRKRLSQMACVYEIACMFVCMYIYATSMYVCMYVCMFLGPHRERLSQMACVYEIACMCMLRVSTYVCMYAGT